MSDENNRQNMGDPRPVEAEILSVLFCNKNENQAEITEEKNEIDESAKIESEDINTGVVIKNVESESLNSLMVYDSDSSSSSEEIPFDHTWQQRKVLNDSSTSTNSSDAENDSDDDDNESDSDSESDEDNDIRMSNLHVTESKGVVYKERAIKRDELLPAQLPPVPDLSTLNISENEEFVHMGNVFGIIDNLVTVAALPNIPAYDLDTLFFLDNGKKPLGFVFDVLGPVTSPVYAVRFNSVEDIKRLQVEIGTEVYSAPSSEHTQYVFLQQLLRMKGSDASWFGDKEVPAEFADYSDDEDEQYNRCGKEKHGAYMRRSNSDKYKKFENAMNQRNILNTKFNNYVGSYKSTHLQKSKTGQNQASYITAGVPMFNPSVPPPNISHCMRFYQHQGLSPLSIQSECVTFFYSHGSENSEASSSGTSDNQDLTQNSFANNSRPTNSANHASHGSSNGDGGSNTGSSHSVIL